MKQRIFALTAAALLLAALLGGCNNNPAKTGEAPKTDDPKAQDTAILVVSFGTSYNDSREATIGAIEKAIQEKFPDYPVRRAFTSQIIIDKLKERDNLSIDNVTEALDRAAADGIKTLIVQPTHLMNGYEYTDLADELKEYADKFDRIALGEPLLTSDEDFQAVAKAIADETARYQDGSTAICYMGHGTEADSNSVYSHLQTVLTDEGYQNIFIGTVEAAPTLEDVTGMVKEGGYTKVLLAPLMVVAGDHANNDMAGDEEDSWKSQFAAAGYQVECLLQGLGEDAAIQQIYVQHTQAAVDSLK